MLETTNNKFRRKMRAVITIQIKEIVAVGNRIKTIVMVKNIQIG